LPVLSCPVSIPMRCQSNPEFLVGGTGPATLGRLWAVDISFVKVYILAHFDIHKQSLKLNGATILVFTGKPQTMLKVIL
jgi:hypothetical protein